MSLLDSRGLELGEGTVISNHVEPGESAVEKNGALAGGASPGCVVAKVTRDASG